MEGQNEFYIYNNEKKYKATILTNFEIYGDCYCIYTIPDKNTKKYQVFCAKILDNNLKKIESIEERNLTNKIVSRFIQSIHD